MPSRRDMLLGAGALVAGGGAVLGTGAFTSVQAERTVSVETAGDANAFLQITEVSGSANAAYVSTNNGQVELDFSSGNTNVSGDGFNLNGVTVVDRLLAVTNQGTQTVNFHVDVNGLDLSDGNGGQAYLAIEPVPVGNNGRNPGLFNIKNVAVGGNGDQIAGTHSGINFTNPQSGHTVQANDIFIPVGNTLQLDLIIDTRNYDPSGQGGFPQSLGGTVTFVADEEDGVNN